MSETLPSETLPHSYRQTRFDYEDVSERLIGRIVQQVEDEKSVILLGPRGVGKQHLLSRVESALGADHVVLRLRCDSWDPSKSEASLVAAIRQRLPNCALDDFNSLTQVNVPLRNYLEAHPVKVTFLVSNVDVLPGAVARRLLILFRELKGLSTNALGCFGMLVTGSADLAPLVYGADSEFTANYQYVIQGYDRDLFRQQAIKQLGPLLPDLNDPLVALLWTECGGSHLALQIVCAALGDHRRRQDIESGLLLTTAEVCSVLEQLSQHQHVLTDVFQQSFIRLEASIVSLRLLRNLLKSETCELPAFENVEDGITVVDAPSELELCGLARRKWDKLVWHSALVRILARQYFSPRILGDALACNNAWGDATACYREADEKRYPWIQSAGQRPRLRAAQRAFESHLHQIAGDEQRSIDDLVTFFATGARNMLGFDSITRWRFQPESQSWWSVDASSKSEVMEVQVKTRIESLLPQNDVFEGGELKVEKKADRPFVVLFGMPVAEDFPRDVLVMSCIESGNPLTRVRREQIDPVLEAFMEAYQRACWKKSASSRIQYQTQLLESLPEVFKLAGQTPDRTRNALKKAGETLRKHGYRRVMFSMVDQVGQRIKGVVDCCGDDAFDLATATDYPLLSSIDPRSQSRHDVQQDCVQEKRTIIVNDAEKFLTANQRVVQNAGLQAMVIVPIILKGSRTVLGTMHVERKDQKPLSQNQILSLEYFGEQLAEAIDAATTIDLLEDGVQEQADATMLLNNRDEVVFANKHAADLFFIKNGWNHDLAKPSAEWFLPHAVTDVLRTATKLNVRVSQYADLERKLGGQHVVSAKPLQDWRGCRNGTLLQVQCIQKTTDLLQSIRDFASCPDVESLVDCLMASLKSLGHQYGRLYLIDERDGSLRGYRQFGFPEGSEGAVAFSSGQVVLQSQTLSPLTWVCLFEQKVLLRKCVEGPEIGTVETNSFGLEAKCVSPVGCPYEFLEKKLGEVSIDAPLLSADRKRWYGKLTLAYRESMTPEDFERLKILAEAASAALGAFAELARRRRQEDEKQRRAMETAIERTCHQLQSKITSLETLSRLYKHATTPERIEELNREWADRRRKLQDILKQTSQHLRPISLHPRSVNLLDHLRTVLTQHLEEEQFQIDSPLSKGPLPQRFEAVCDPELIEEALDELINNSRKAVAGGGGELHVRIHVSERAILTRDEILVRIEYRDNGPGIPEEVKERLFEEFCSHWPGRSVEGTGLGLSLVQRILRAHGGTIHNEPSTSGACFVMEFPRYSRGHTANDSPGDGENGGGL